MAPPSNRRPGYSRKAQYSLFAAYVLAVAGAIFAALLLVISIVDPKGFNALRTAGDEISAPVARFFNSIRRSFGDMGENMSAYFDAASKNAELSRRVERNKTALQEAAAIKVENARLRKLLGLAETQEERGVVARLISTTASSSRRIATLSEGSSSGIESGQPVRGPTGLIGRVISVGPNTSRILLITDADNVVPVMRASDGLPAFASGLANGNITIRPINLGMNPFKLGDVIVTSGNGGLYQPNIPVAQVVRKVSDGAIARPYADPAQTPYVITLPVFMPEALAAQSAETDRESSGE